MTPGPTASTLALNKDTVQQREEVLDVSESLCAGIFSHGLFKKIKMIEAVRLAADELRLQALLSSIQFSMHQFHLPLCFSIFV
jgi:hypothetical protein